MTKYNKDLFAVSPIFYRLFIIAITLGAYYYIDQNGLFPEWHTIICSVVKVIIAYEIIVGALRTFVLPGLTLISGLLCLFSEMFYNTTLLPATEAWQLIIVSVIGIVITIFTQL